MISQTRKTMNKTCTTVILTVCIKIGKNQRMRLGGNYAM